MKIAVLGAGAWGTAMAAALATRHDTVLWARDATQAEAMAQQRRNARYLPEVELPQALRIEADFAAACAHAEGGLLLLAPPMAGLRGLLQALPAQQPALWLCKGFEAGSGLLGHEIARSLRPDIPGGVLSGPSFALEVARAQPTALVAASADEALAAAAAQALHGEALRVYTVADVVGVEVGGALKNVLAIATGMLDGLAATGEHGAPGLNARAALITRGLAEMTRLGVALGARPETFAGLAGMGDLVLTCTGALSRNRAVGVEVGKGRPLEEVLAATESVAEGVTTTESARALAVRMGVDMPIVAAVARILFEQQAPHDALADLMGRELRPERDG